MSTTDPRTMSGVLCRICHTPISHPGAECPHCRSRSTLPSIPPVLMLAAAFGAMVILTGVATLLTWEYREQKAERRLRHLQAASAAADEGHYEEAATSFRDALEFDREDVTARLGLAEALIHVGRDAEAWNHLVEVRSVVPTNAVVNRLLGDAAQTRGLTDEAVSYYRAAIHGLWPEDAAANRLETRLALIDLLGARGDSLQEVSELVDLMQEMPDDLPTMRRVGQLLVEAGAPAQAVDIFKSVLDREPTDAESWTGLARAEFGRAHYLSARTAYSKALALDADRADVLAELQLCNQIVDLDPTFRRAGTRERLRRSQQILQRTVAEGALCLESTDPEPGGARAPLEAMLPEAREALDREVRAAKSEEAVEANLSLAERLWQRRLEACPDLPPADTPLRHVLEKLSQ